MARLTRAVRAEVLYAAVATCVFASSLGAQRIDDLATGPVLRAARLDVGEGDSSRESDVSIVQHGIVIGSVRHADEAESLTGVPLRAPARRCDAVFPFVAFGALAAMGGAALAQILPGARPFREILIPVAVVAVVAIGFAAAICNR